MLNRRSLISALVLIGLNTSYADIVLRTGDLEHNPIIMEHNQGYVVDINAPGSDGVSYNTYDRFNIDLI